MRLNIVKKNNFHIIMAVSMIVIIISIYSLFIDGFHGNDIGMLILASIIFLLNISIVSIKEVSKSIKWIGIFL